MLSIIVASISFVIIILILVVFILFCRRKTGQLKPADVIPAVSFIKFYPLLSKDQKTLTLPLNGDDLNMKFIADFL